MKSLFSFIILILMIATEVIAQDNYPERKSSDLQIMTADGEKENDLYVLKKASLTDSTAMKVRNAASTTFIGESARLFAYVQNYLYNEGVIQEPEPPVLAITNRQGCFGVMGFVLDENGKRTARPFSGYVDLHKDQFSKDYCHLESITQLFPHEMGHVMQMYLCTDLKNAEPESKSPNMHYFNLTTCYNTAFSEGFAEHFENIARKTDPSEKVRKGIIKDIEKERKTLPRYVKGFNNDYRLPLRIGYYRAITPLWYQKLENLKRYELVENGLIKYSNTILPGLNTHKALIYRNTGVGQDKTQLRNAAQAASTEGVVSAFFSNLVLSSLNQKYMPAEFYVPFGIDSLKSSEAAQHISQLDNEYMKIFRVMHTYVKTSSTEKGQLFDFVEGYCKEYPDEASQVMAILKETTGVTQIPGYLPELWVLNRGYNHNFWVMAQFGLTVPYYAFNLNTADPVDILTFSDIPAGDASRIINYREENGFFHSLSDINNVPGISEKTKNLLVSNKYDEKNVPDDSGNPNLMSLIYLPLIHLGCLILIWFIPVLAFYLFLIRKMDMTVRRRTIKAVLQLAKFLLLGLAALASLALTSWPWQLFIATGLAVLALKAVILRKRKQELKVSLTITSIMIIILLYSLV